MSGKVLVVEKRWTERHPSRYGATAGNDERAATIEHHEFNGRTYQTETVYCNGTVTYSGQYPAGTEYARKRMALYA